MISETLSASFTDLSPYGSAHFVDAFTSVVAVLKIRAQRQPYLSTP
jgi:hypothetical protein